jgi:hypothetical protein
MAEVQYGWDRAPSAIGLIYAGTSRWVGGGVADSSKRYLRVKRAEMHTHLLILDWLTVNSP